MRFKVLQGRLLLGAASEGPGAPLRRLPVLGVCLGGGLQQWCVNLPQLLPGISEGTFAVETTSAAKDCFSHYDTPVAEQLKFHGDKYAFFLSRVSLHLTPFKCTWLKIQLPEFHRDLKFTGIFFLLEPVFW